MRANDLTALSGVDRKLFHMASNKSIWRLLYERDFKASLPSNSTIAPQHLYYIRSISGFRSIDRMKTINNMLFPFRSHLTRRNALHQVTQVVTPIRSTLTIGIWTIEFDVPRPHGNSHLEDIGIHFSGRQQEAWNRIGVYKQRLVGVPILIYARFRYRDYSGNQFCVYR